MTRVVVTGMGTVNPLGNDVAEFKENLFAGKLGIAPITKFDASETGITNAGEVKNFDSTLRIGKKAAKRMDLYSQYAVDTALQAIEDAGITEENTASEDMGVIFGSGIGGLTTIQEQVIKLRVKAKNICTSIVTACSSGTNSIGEAYRQIKEGRAKVMLTGGAEASVNEIGIAGFAALTALSDQVDPTKASIPFDKERSGFVMGEGSGCLVLEELEHAKARGARIIAEMVGYGSTCDAYHMTAPDPTGEGAARAMKQAIDEAGIKPEDVGYVNAHGTATKANDAGEAKAINLVFKDYQVPVSSTKSMTGHLLGAAGAVEACATILSLQNGRLPVNIGMTTQDEECKVNIVTKDKESAPDLEYAISNSLGFGGHNAVVAFRKWSE